MISPLVQAQAQFALDVSSLIREAFRLGYIVSLGEVWRTPEQQAIYVKMGRSRTMNSQHLSRLAIDLVLRKGDTICATVEDFRPLGDYWCSLRPENEWGGNWRSFKDAPHFQRRSP